MKEKIKLSIYKEQKIKKLLWHSLCNPAEWSMKVKVERALKKNFRKGESSEYQRKRSLPEPVDWEKSKWWSLLRMEMLLWNNFNVGVANASQGSELYVFCRSSRAWAWTWILSTGILLQVKEMTFLLIKIIIVQACEFNSVWDMAMHSSFVMPQVNTGSETKM